MISINEIRIGNVLLNRFNEIERLNYVDTMQWIEDDFSGISLNGELLIKLNFTEKKLITTTFYEDHNISLTLGNKRSGYAFFLKGWKGYSKGIRYLHELQNLYFILTGNELNIEILLK